MPETASDSTDSSLLVRLRDVIAQDLAPHVAAIDQTGVYPRAFLQRVGAIGGFAQAIPTRWGGVGRGLAGTLRVMEEVSRDCLSTGFCVWCQTVCGWYVQNGESDYLKKHFLPDIASGRLLAGTGLSNLMKHLGGTEPVRVTATRTDGGFLVKGALPWISNVAEDHCFAFGAQVTSDSTYLMVVVPADTPGLTLGDGGHFIGLEGSSTHSVVFKQMFLPDRMVLAVPCLEYVARIRPGFILAQTGFGLGLVRSCIGLMRHANERGGAVNRYLDDGPDHLEADLQKARRRVYTLADEIGCGEIAPGPAAIREAIHCRILVSELSLRASQAAMLHTGTAGYRTGSIAERKLRESYFVAIVTPSLKQLKKLQRDLQQGTLPGK